MTIAPAHPAAVQPWNGSPAISDLLRQAEEAQAATKLAELAIHTAFVPDSLRVWQDPDAARAQSTGAAYRADLAHMDEDRTISQVAVAIVKGVTLGFPWTTALEIIVVINSRPFVTSLGLRAMIQRTPFLRMEVTEANSGRAIVTGWRRGDDGTWSSPQVSTWDLERARKGIRSFGQRDGMWQTNPGNMLLARATAEDARIIGADIVLGLPYVAEEVDSFGEPEWEADGGAVSPPTAPPSPGSRQRRAGPRVPRSAKPGPDPGPAMITDDQKTELHAALAKTGVTKAADQRALVNLKLGLSGDDQVKRMDRLTEEQAAQLLRDLSEEAATAADAHAAKDTPPGPGGDGKANGGQAGDSGAQGKLGDDDSGEGAK